MNEEDAHKLVLAEVRAEKIKLWLPPYVEKDTNYPCHTKIESIESLAQRFAGKLPYCSKDRIVEVLLSLQNHALEKLASKATEVRSPGEISLEIKLLGLNDGALAIDPQTQPSILAWAGKTSLDGRNLNLERVNPDLTSAKLMDDLCSLVEASALRFVHRGRTIPADEKSLVETIRQSARKNGPESMLCLVSYTDNVSSKSSGSLLEDDNDLALVARIRDASRKLPLNSMLDLTDQHGTNVSMTQTDRLAFMTALGMHRLGRERIDHEERISSALVLLLEADKEWSRVGDEWRKKVDNYGLLQLDIAWVYFKLKSLTHLPDAIQRLETAETALRQLVNKNFVTLAIAQADMGNPVPPLAAVFCRLFLLQGVAYSYSPERQSKSQERLDWARVLCQSLRNVAPETAVDVWCEAAGVSRSQAISVLRRTNGDADKAIELLQESRTNEVRQAQRREIQRKIGLCANAKDHVDLDLVNSLESMLGFSPVSSDTAHWSDGDSKPSLSLAYRVAAGLLRLADNDMQRAIDMYSLELNRSPDAVLERISALDKCFEENIMSGRSRQRNKRRRRGDSGGEDNPVSVDEVALASLLSMGVDESLAREALRRNKNNVEQSLLWVTGQDNTMNNEGANEDEAAANTNTSDPERVESATKQASAAVQDDGQDIAEAEDFLRDELRAALSHNDIEKEYLGSTLDEEWAFLVSMQDK